MQPVAAARLPPDVAGRNVAQRSHRRHCARCPPLLPLFFLPNRRLPFLPSLHSSAAHCHHLPIIAAVPIVGRNAAWRSRPPSTIAAASPLHFASRPKPSDLPSPPPATKPSASLLSLPPPRCRRCCCCRSTLSTKVPPDLPCRAGCHDLLIHHGHEPPSPSSTSHRRHPPPAQSRCSCRYRPPSSSSLPPPCFFHGRRSAINAAPKLSMSPLQTPWLPSSFSGSSRRPLPISQVVAHFPLPPRRKLIGHPSSSELHLHHRISHLPPARFFATDHLPLSPLHAIEHRRPLSSTVVHHTSPDHSPSKPSSPQPEIHDHHLCLHWHGRPSLLIAAPKPPWSTSILHPSCHLLYSEIPITMSHAITAIH